MDPRGNFAATLLDASGSAYAKGAVARLMESAVGERARALGGSSLTADVRARLACLAESLASGRPELFLSEIRWLASTWAARGVDRDILEALLRCLREELAEDLPPPVAGPACQILDDARAALPESPEPTSTLLADGKPHVELARRFLLFVLEGDRKHALELIVDAFEGGTPIEELHRDVLAASQAELGRLWQVGDSIASEEHVGTRIVEDALTLLRTRMQPAPANGRSVLVASVRGNLHDIGARMVADQFELAGWRSVLLGADTPTEDLLQAVEFFRADLLALSAGRGHNVRATAEIVRATRERFENLPVLVGGLPFTLLPDLWQTVGADGFASDAPGAVREGDRLIAERSKASDAG